MVGPAAGRALAELRSGSPVDLVITDLGMPGMTGTALASEVKRQRPVPVVLLTGWADELEGSLVRLSDGWQALVLRGLLPTVPPGGAPYYYLIVRGDRSNPETAYTLHATAQVLGPDAELEPNDIVDKAQLIPPDRTVVHAMWTQGDIDCFAIAPAPARFTRESARREDVCPHLPTRDRADTLGDAGACRGHLARESAPPRRAGRGRASAHRSHIRDALADRPDCCRARSLLDPPHRQHAAARRRACGPRDA